MGFDGLKFRKVAAEALLSSSLYIVDEMLGKTNRAYRIKEDRSIVTRVDIESQRLGRKIILSHFPHYRLNQEEAEIDGGMENSEIVIYHDPLDGTRSFLLGGVSSCVGLSVYDSKKKQVLAAATMEPISGRFWSSLREGGTWLSRYDYHTQEWTEEAKISVNQDGLRGSSVLVDTSRPFKKRFEDGQKKMILSQDGRRSLTSGLENAGLKEMTFNTNCGHYAYLSLGSPSLIGVITTAIGGPFDIGGILHVNEAGGISQCYQIEGERDRSLELISGEDIENADMVIAANNESNLRALEKIVAEAIEKD